MVGRTGARFDTTQWIPPTAKKRGREATFADWERTNFMTPMEGVTYAERGVVRGLNAQSAAASGTEGP
jgi:hypothetical protein